MTARPLSWPPPVAGRPGVVARWRGVRRLLVIRLDNLGDVLMTTPAIALLRGAMPQARVTALLSPGSAAAAPHWVDIDHVIPFDAPWVKAPRAALPNAAPQLGQAEARLIDRLSEAQFDAAVIFTVCTQSALPAALLCLLAGIPRRLAHCRENPYGLLTDWVPDTEVVADGMRHEVERQMALLAPLGIATPAEPPRLRFQVTADDRALLRQRLVQAGLAPHQRYFVVHPGASAPSRRWPAPRFGAAADGLALATGCVPVFTGDAAEHALVEQARGVMQQPSISLAGCLGLGELAALIERADLLMANNTGPAHLAAALGTPVVDLYAQTNPQHTPWRVPSRVLSHPVPCRHCLKSECPQGHHDCLTQVAPHEAVSAGLELMALGAPTSRPPRPVPVEARP